ncbi:MAG: molybdopterin biosynthesis protein [Myxococcales bacterium]|nr:molybdopterin biosynthesis protein [Myxococcales bacterium]
MGAFPVKQTQFLDVIDRDEAERRWHEVIDFAPVGIETVALESALGRVLAEDVRSEVDVPGFDRSNMDGFAVLAADTFGASEEKPVRLRLNQETIPTGVIPKEEVRAGTATMIATGGMLPRGADAVVPVEHTDIEEAGDSPSQRVLVVRHSRVPGAALSFAGTDMGRGETVLFSGTLLTSRETGLLAAIGREELLVWRRPTVAIISTGDEIVQPGEAMRPGLVYDSNGRILADAVRELGGEPDFYGAFRDDLDALRGALTRAIKSADLVLLSGGTSKGEGDLNGLVVAELDPGIAVHGVALKPGKPICLASHHRQPVVILPGFPTSAIFTFHEFVAPVIRMMAGLPADRAEEVEALMAQQVVSERGRLEYLLVGLVESATGGLRAYPMGKGSGSVTTFSRADGFVRVGRNTEIVEASEPVKVTRIGREVPVADMVMIGSHCAGLDAIASALSKEGFRIKLLAVGSLGGLAAARRGECDVAPLHLLDPESGEYNAPFLDEGLRLLSGYRRMQGVVTRVDEQRSVEALLADGRLRMVNRNRGSGTRILIDQLLGDLQPPGFPHEPRSHYAVAAAVAQERADWGVTIETVALQAGLRFQPLTDEQYDFAVPEDRWDRPAVVALRRLLEPGSELRKTLEGMGFRSPSS